MARIFKARVSILTRAAPHDLAPGNIRGYVDPLDPAGCAPCLPRMPARRHAGTSANYPPVRRQTEALHRALPGRALRVAPALPCDTGAGRQRGGQRTVPDDNGDRDGVRRPERARTRRHAAGHTGHAARYSRPSGHYRPAENHTIQHLAAVGEGRSAGAEWRLPEAHEPGRRNPAGGEPAGGPGADGTGRNGPGPPDAAKLCVYA